MENLYIQPAEYAGPQYKKTHSYTQMGQLILLFITRIRRFRLFRRTDLPRRGCRLYKRLYWGNAPLFFP